MNRPDKATALALLALNEHGVTVEDPEFLTDVDGRPLAVVPHSTEAILACSPEGLGWTQAELDDPTITH